MEPWVKISSTVESPEPLPTWLVPPDPDTVSGIRSEKRVRLALNPAVLEFARLLPITPMALEKD
jgi:hypothetical protein